MSRFHSRRRVALLSTFVATIFPAAAYSQSATVVLQNGLNGYTGMQDTYIENLTPSVGRGSDTLLQSWCG